MDTPRVKPKLATAWLGGCSGCHMSFLDLDERLIELAGRAEVCASPIMDVKEFPEVDVALVEGAVANEENLEQLRLIRQRAKTLISFGDCAVTGNVTALRNVFPVEALFGRAYRETADPVAGVPEGDGIVPKLLDRVRPLHELVEVDYFLPGCPPSADKIYRLLLDLLEGRKPDTQGYRFGV